MVMGTDSAGRLNEEEFITWWKTTKEPRWLMEKDGKGMKRWKIYSVTDSVVQVSPDVEG